MIEGGWEGVMNAFPHAFPLSSFAVLNVSLCCLVLSRLALFLFLFLCETFSRQKGETRARQGKTTGTERSGDRNAEQGARVRGRPGGTGSGN